MSFLSLSTLAQLLSGCDSVEIKDREACYVNGRVSLGATCASTVGDRYVRQVPYADTLKMLEARPAEGGNPAHAPAVFQTADDYGEETIELETACRILGDNCTYELQTSIDNRKATLHALGVKLPTVP